VLINVQSVGSWVPQPYSVAYSAAKFGLRGFSEALRGELGDYPEIRVCDLFPSFVDTPGIRHAANYGGAALRPAPPLLDPRVVAREIVRLADSPRIARQLGISGQALRLASLLLPGYVRLSARLVEHAMHRAAPAPRTDGGLFRPPPVPRSIDGGWRDGLSLPQKLAAGTALAGLAAVGLVVKRAAPVIAGRR
jgi:NAD(P)-dependent dehydrogenase (short-subunit alcohol dehydrogenase family)